MAQPKQQVMETIINKPLTTEAEAIGFLKSLHENNEHYHPEDDAQDIRFAHIEVSKEERDLLNQRMNECFALLPDPCEIMLDLIEEDKKDKL